MSNPFRTVRQRWHARQRRIDMEILWPQLLTQARDLEHAKKAFALHCLNGTAWQELGQIQIMEFVDSLEAYD